MKKDKVKSAKRTIRDDIKLSLVKEIKALTVKFGSTSDKLEKVINRAAKELAKKISKEIKIEEPVAAAATQPKPAVKAVKTPEAPKPTAKAVKTPEAPKPAAEAAKTTAETEPAIKAVKTAGKKVKVKVA